MAITRQRLLELEKKEKQLEEMKKMLGAQKAKVADEVDIIEDAEPEVHFSSGKTARYQQPQMPTKMLPPKEKKGLFGLRRKKEDSRYEEMQKIKEKVTEESPEIMFQKWLEQSCGRGCHLCEDCVQHIERIISVR